MMEKRRSLKDDMDGLRKMLLLEPRGYPCQNADIIFSSVLEGVDFGFVILEQVRHWEQSMIFRLGAFCYRQSRVVI